MEVHISHIAEAWLGEFWTLLYLSYFNWFNWYLSGSQGWLICFQWKFSLFFFCQEIYHKRMDTHIDIAETLCCSPETITVLLTGYNLIQNKRRKKFRRKKNRPHFPSDLIMTFALQFFYNAYCIYLSGCIVAPCGIFIAVCRVFSYRMQTLSCSLWDLVPWPGMEPSPLVQRVLATGSPEKSLLLSNLKVSILPSSHCLSLNLCFIAY